MRIAIAINKNHPNYHSFLAFLSQAVVLTNDLTVDIVSFASLDEVYGLVNKKCDYILILHRYCYIDFDKLCRWLLSVKPNIAGLSTNKGVGYPYLLIIKTNLAQPISKKATLSPDETENYFLNWTQGVSPQKVVTLDNVCYLANANYTHGFFHKSIFVCLSDLDKSFAQTMNMLISRTKEVFYKEKLYRLKIGKSFFIYKHWHFAIIPDRTVLVWSSIKNLWVPANKNENQILEQIL